MSRAPLVPERFEISRKTQKNKQTTLLNWFFRNIATLFLLYSKTYGLREGCRRSLQEIRRLLVNEVQAVYGSQGVFISDKHIEIIVRQMTTKVLILTSGDTPLVPGETVKLSLITEICNALSLTY